MKSGRVGGWLALVGPGFLVAATGVGAGDLATASFAGNKLGVTVLWAVLLGAGFKFILNEGLARWQLATGQTFLEGCVLHLGRPFQIFFSLYLIPWSFFVGAALVSACGVAGQALLPVFADPRTGVVVFGVLHSLLGLILARAGGYRLFEKVMSACIAVMFVTVIGTTLWIGADWRAVLTGLLVPAVPRAGGEEIIWTIALMGGVGGTLTVLCYGYWIRERGRVGPEHLVTCRIDLGVGYLMTGLFGMAMVIIGSQIEVTGQGAGLVVALAGRLGETLGPAGRWIFLAGAWAALFSSLLGVWQSVPYLFADLVRLLSRKGDDPHEPVSTQASSYRIYQYALALVPLVSLGHSFREVQKYYAFIGALFMPLLAFALLYLNGRSRWVGTLQNRPATTAALLGILLLFALLGWLEIQERIPS